MVALGHDLGRRAQGDRPFLLETRVGEAPAHRRVGDLGGLAAPRVARLEHHVRGAGHVFHAAGDEHVALACLHRLGRARRRLQPGAAQPVHRLPGHLDRQAGEQQRHARDVAVVLARLVGAAEDHVVDRGRIDSGALDHGFDRDRGEVIGPNRSQGPTVFADGCPQRRTDVGVVHRPTQTVFVSV